MNLSSKNTPTLHTRKIKARMNQLVTHLRKDVLKVTEPKAQALFETSAEVILGLVKAFEDYEKKDEPAWQAEPKDSRTKKGLSHAPRR